MKSVIFWNSSFGAQLPALPPLLSSSSRKQRTAELSEPDAQSQPKWKCWNSLCLGEFYCSQYWVFCWLLGSLWELLLSLGKSAVQPWGKGRAFKKWGCQGHTLMCNSGFEHWMQLLILILAIFAFFPFPWNSPLILLLFDLLRTAFWKKSWDKLSIYSLKYSVQ